MKKLIFCSIYYFNFIRMGFHTFGSVLSRVYKGTGFVGVVRSGFVSGGVTSRRCALRCFPCILYKWRIFWWGIAPNVNG